MKLIHLSCTIILLTWVLVAGTTAQTEERPKDTAAEELKQLYHKAGMVLAGKYVKEDQIDKPYVRPHTLYTFENCTHFKKGYWGPIETGPISTCEFYVYSGAAPSLEKAEKGKRYIVFRSVDFGEALASLPETFEWIELLKGWVKNGIYSKAERAKLYDKAGWVIVVDKPKEKCLESYPCRHLWMFSAVKVLKGEKVPDKINIRGGYKKHNDMPDPLKAISSSGKLILFMDEIDNFDYSISACWWDNPRNDTSVFGVMPWSEGMERELIIK